MRICAWSDSSFEQSYASYHLMKGMLQAMLEKGHEVWLVQVQWEDGAMPEDMKNYSNLHIVNIPQEKAGKTNFASRYLKTIEYFQTSKKEIEKAPKPDVFFLQSTNAAYFPVKYAKRWGIPIVYNVQDIFPIDALVTGMLSKKHPAFIGTRWMQAMAYKKADRVVTISEDLKKTIQGEGRKDVDVVYNWSYQNTPYDIKDEDNHFLKEYGIKREDGFRIVYAGNIGKMMNAEMMVQTAVLLKNYRDIKFYIIGTGSNVKYLTRRVEEEKLENMLFFPSQPMEYAPDNYCMADVNINPVPKSVMYTCMPSKTNTCLLSQKPTVVSMDLDSDMAKRLSKVDQWTVVAPDDADAMAAAILEYYRNIDWKHGESKKSVDAGEFMSKFGPVENAYEYVSILEEAAKK